MDLRLGENDFTVGRIPARRRLRLLHAIARLIAPALGKAAGAAANAPPGGFKKADLDVGGMVEAVLLRLDAKETDALVDELLAATYVRHGERQVLVMPVFDAVFEERLQDFPALVKAALEVNYKSFFSDVLSTLAPMLARGASPAAPAPPPA